MNSLDERYFKLIASKDDNGVKKLVSEAAASKGYTVKLWHWTWSGSLKLAVKSEYEDQIKDLKQAEFWKFDLKHSPQGFHFGTEKAALDRKRDTLGELSQSYIGIEKIHSRLMNVWLQTNNVIEFPDIGNWTAEFIFIFVRDELNEKYSSLSRVEKDFYDNHKDILIELEKIRIGEFHNDFYNGMDYDDLNYKYAKKMKQILHNHGIDAIRYKNDGEDTGSYSYVLFDNAKIKLADPIVFDKKGIIIPLSERFDIRNSDIRK